MHEKSNIRGQYWICEQVNQVNQVMGRLASVNKRSREQRTSKQGSKSVDTHSVTTVELSNSKHMYFSLDKNRLSIEWLRKRLFVHWIYTLIDRILMTRPGRCHWIPNSNIRGKKQMQSTMQISTYRIRYRVCIPRNPFGHAIDDAIEPNQLNCEQSIGRLRTYVLLKRSAQSHPFEVFWNSIVSNGIF